MPEGGQLSAEMSAHLAAMHLRIDGMLRRLAPERAAEHAVRRAALLGDAMARGGTLTVGVVSGRGLPKMDRWGKSDPYVVLELGGQRVRTAVVKRSLQPEWEETFTLSVQDHSDLLTATCMDWDFAQAHDFMGAISVPIRDLIDQDVDRFFPLRDGAHGLGMPLKGAIRLRLAYRPSDATAIDARAALRGLLRIVDPMQADNLLREHLRTSEAAGSQDIVKAPRRASAPRFSSVSGGPSLVTAASDPESGIGLNCKAWTAAEKALVERRRRDNLEDIEKSRAEQEEYERREAEQRELERLRNLQRDMSERLSRETEALYLENNARAVLGRVAALARPVPRDPAVPVDPAQRRLTMTPPRAAHGADNGFSQRSLPLPQCGSMTDRSRPWAAGRAGDDIGQALDWTGNSGETSRGVLTAMHSADVSIDAKRQLMTKLRASKKFRPPSPPKEFQDDVQRFRELLLREQDASQKMSERADARRTEAEERERTRIVLLQEERKKQMLAEKRQQQLQLKESWEQKDKEAEEARKMEIEARRQVRLQERQMELSISGGALDSTGTSTQRFAGRASTITREDLRRLASLRLAS